MMLLRCLPSRWDNRKFGSIFTAAVCGNPGGASASGRRSLLVGLFLSLAEPVFQLSQDVKNKGVDEPGAPLITPLTVHFSKETKTTYCPLCMSRISFPPTAPRNEARNGTVSEIRNTVPTWELISPGFFILGQISSDACLHGGCSFTEEPGQPFMSHGTKQGTGRS